MNSAAKDISAPVSSRSSSAVAAAFVESAKVALLTGGADKPYALGMASALAAAVIPLDFIGSDEINGPELHNDSRIRFLNLRGDQSVNASVLVKSSRVFRYYWRLIAYAAKSKAPIFHILWNNKFEHFDRTVLLLYYKLLGKKLVFTAHNVNTAARDGKDSWFNRLTLRIQYALVDHIFVHTQRMKAELLNGYGVGDSKATVIPFGINNTLRDSNLTRCQAREMLGLSPNDKVVLFFGNIAPYKGLEYLIEAFSRLAGADAAMRLLVVGRPKNCAEYWVKTERQIATSPASAQILKRIEFVPDESVEIFCKASDVLVLPYTHIFQSGVLFVGYSFGLPVIATDVGSLREDIIEGETGLIAEPMNPDSLAQALQKFFASETYRGLEFGGRARIKTYANDRYSWSRVAEMTAAVYASLMR
jgi:D-inositol-3-phosphate glycosyltransferase